MRASTSPTIEGAKGTSGVISARASEAVSACLRFDCTVPFSVSRSVFAAGESVAESSAAKDFCQSRSNRASRATRPGESGAG